MCGGNTQEVEVGFGSHKEHLLIYVFIADLDV